MAAGIGVDMLEIARMERVMRRRPNFLKRVFTDEERAYCDGSARPADNYAARFAAREAVLKALGSGFADGVGLKDVSVGRADNGRPICILTGRAAQIAQEQGVVEVALSLSTTHSDAVATAVTMTDETRPKSDKEDDPARKMQASFKEARTIIDELERLTDGIRDTLEEAPASADADLGLSSDTTDTTSADPAQ